MEQFNLFSNEKRHVLVPVNEMKRTMEIREIEALYLMAKRDWIKSQPMGAYRYSETLQLAEKFLEEANRFDVTSEEIETIRFRLNSLNTWLLKMRNHDWTNAK